MAYWKVGGEISLSLDEMRRAASLAPDVASIRHNLATLLASAGDIEGSAREFEQALKIKPDDTQAFYGLTQNMKFREVTPRLSAMVDLHGTKLTDEQRETLAFGLAKAFDDLGDAERAMTYAVEANALVQRPFAVADEDRAVNELRDLERLDVFRRTPRSSHPSKAPLFIVGMNRSGTTLVESILSRHPQVLALGEMGQMVEVEQAAFSQRGRGTSRAFNRHRVALEVDRDWLAARAEALMKRSAARASKPFLVVTDKLPENAVRLGLVSRLFPNGRAIYVRRHPLDAGVSNFFQRFAVGQGYSYRMDWVGKRTRQIADSMAIWKRAIDFPILDVSYERLVADPEGESRRIVEFTGLAWNDACLEPQRTQRSVLTASQWQVRQPVYRSSVGRWKRYERWLGPMIEAMGGMEWVEAEAADAAAYASVAKRSNSSS
jgi:tetratricopeptide (TPR) repeat protein